MNFKKIVATIISLLFCNFAYCYEYKLIKRDNHVIHSILIDPKFYNIELAKAKNKVFGRETVKDIAIQHDAKIAINAGFFTIGKEDDGRTLGALVIDGKIFGLSFDEYYCIIKNLKGKVTIDKVNIKPELKIGKNRFTIKGVNVFSSKGSNVLYSRLWDKNIPNENRTFILIDEKHKVTDISNQLDKEIPGGYYLFSIAKENLKRIKKGDLVKFPSSIFLKSSNISMVKGTPLLIKNGVINKDIKLKESNFYTYPHARTAIGIRKDGKIVIVVVENHYDNRIKSMTLEQAKNLAKAKGLNIEDKKIERLYNILKGHDNSNPSVIGLKMVELAKLMLELKCVDAINLDGGGSSSLFIKDKIVNKTIGDEDAALGQLVARPVSDAIIFKTN